MYPLNFHQIHAPVVQTANVVTLALETAVRVPVVGAMGPLVAVETTASVRLVTVAVNAPPAKSAVSSRCWAHYLLDILPFFSLTSANCKCGSLCKCSGCTDNSCCPCTCIGCDGKNCRCDKDKCRCDKECCASKWTHSQLFNPLPVYIIQFEKKHDIVSRLIYGNWNFQIKSEDNHGYALVS